MVSSVPKQIVKHWVASVSGTRHRNPNLMSLCTATDVPLSRPLTPPPATTLAAELTAPPLPVVQPVPWPAETTNEECVRPKF